jgi:hypothetical protein
MPTKISITAKATNIIVRIVLFEIMRFPAYLDARPSSVISGLPALFAGRTRNPGLDSEARKTGFRIRHDGSVAAPE